MVAYRHIKCKGQPQTQVLVKWVGLPDENRSWENIEFINRLLSVVNLEDKINLEGSGDVTVELKLGAVAAKLKEDLELSFEEEGGITTNPTKPEESRRRSRRTKRANQNNDFLYY